MSTLHEAVALGLVAIREHDWTGEIPDGLKTVEVSVSTVSVTHAVRMQDLKKWINRTGGKPL